VAPSESAERLFGDVSADACEVTFQLGLPGELPALAEPAA
jgi:hypothetical protein